MKENGVFSVPNHRMLAANWYFMYQRHHAGIPNALHNDCHAFTMQMTRICNQHIFQGLKRFTNYDPYEIWFEYTGTEIIPNTRSSKLAHPNFSNNQEEFDFNSNTNENITQNITQNMNPYCTASATRTNK